MAINVDTEEERGGRKGGRRAVVLLEDHKELSRYERIATR